MAQRHANLLCSLARASAHACAFALALALAWGTGLGEATAKESGLPIGNLVAKPSVTIDALYDSNVLRTQLDPQGDFGLEIKPTFELVYPGDNFRWELQAWYRFFTYFNLGGNNHDVLRTFTDFGVTSSFDVNRKGKVGFRFAPAFSNQRSGRGVEASTGGDSDFAFQTTVAAPLGVQFRPTKAFLIDVDGSWTWTRAYFPDEPLDTDPLVLGNSHDVAGKLKVDWRFFPRSHFLFEGSGGHVFQGDISTADVRHAPAMPADYFRVWAGLRGDVTRKLSLMGSVGYGNIFFGEEKQAQNLSGVDGLLGRFELALRPLITQRIAFGFSRDFYFRYYASRIMDTQGYVKYRGLIADRLAVLADFSYTYRQLLADETDARSNSRSENQWSAGAGVEIMAKEWFHVTAKYRFSAVNPSSTNEGEYIDNRVNIGVIFGFR